MNTETASTTNPVPEFDFDLEQLAAALLAKEGITKGLWRLAARLRFAGITTSVRDADRIHPVPAGMVGIEGMALFKVDAPGELVFDAAKLARRNVQRRKSSTAKSTGRAADAPRRA